MAFLKIPSLFSVEPATTHAKFAPAKRVVSLAILADPFPQVEDYVCAILELLITPPPKPAQLVLTLVFHAFQVPLHVLHVIPPSGISFLLQFSNASAKLEHFKTERLAIHAWQDALNAQTRQRALFADQALTEILMETTYAHVSRASMMNWALYSHARDVITHV
jgi:hypothetical protein